MGSARLRLLEPIPTRYRCCQSSSLWYEKEGQFHPSGCIQKSYLLTSDGRDVHGNSWSLDALLLSCELWLGSWYVGQPRWLSVCTHQCRLLSWTYLGRAPCQSCWTIQCRYCRLLSFFPATLLLAYHFLFGGIGRLCGLVWCGQWCYHRPHDAAFCSYGRLP